MIRALVLIAAPLAVLAYACGDEEEVVPTAAPTAAPTATSDPVPTPLGWLTYADPGGFFSIDYPADWYQDGSSFASLSPADWDGPGLPPDVMEVEVGYYEAVGSDGCGAALALDPKSGAATPREGATSTTLGGLAAWEKTRNPGDPAMQGDFSRIHSVSTVYQGYCVHVAAYFTQESPDEATFELMLASLRFQPVD